MAEFNLRFHKRDIRHWAERYSYPGESRIETVLAPRARTRGYLTRGEFLSLCEWKTPRSKPRCAKNSNVRVREATRLALGTSDEHVKIGILRLLDGRHPSLL
jgi:hypothetical protein